ncbi:hypothetical protein VPNG_05794 [Cytospora leucostoma]|uniref:Uncharacterized protein n=1 Tax=Cytospora leucostoma TaxID=1230097 RepID=A0A423X0A5_9PEZI|nr:hypothetical protein VPNG_05794 [Cytospora leucostoma]
MGGWEEPSIPKVKTLQWGSCSNNIDAGIEEKDSFTGFLSPPGVSAVVLPDKIAYPYNIELETGLQWAWIPEVPKVAQLRFEDVEPLQKWQDTWAALEAVAKRALLFELHRAPKARNLPALAKRSVIIRSSSSNDKQARQGIVAHGSGADSDDEYEVRQSYDDGMDIDEQTALPRPVQCNRSRTPTKEAPLFPGLPVSSRNIGEAEDHEMLSDSSEERQSKYTGVINTTKSKFKTRNKNKNKISGNKTLEPLKEPLPLPMSYGWMVKGTNEHVEDLHLPGIPKCDSEIQSKSKVEVICEYTWIQATPSQEETGTSFPAIYVPGNTRNWKGVKLGASLSQKEVFTTISRAIRDEHTALKPQYPYEPTFRALEVANVEFAFDDIDVVTDSETLTQLLCFICGPRACESPITKPFRLDLSTVRDTLFIIPKSKPGRGYTGPLPKHKRADPGEVVPGWAADVLGHLGSHDPELPYGGGHYRLVRYRFGDVVLAVRVKVDFVYENHKTQTQSPCNPHYGATTEPVSAPMCPDGSPICKTTVKAQGLGTTPDSTGMATVRYLDQDLKSSLNEMIPRLWFSRTTFLVEGVVTYPALEIQEASLIDSRQYYKSFERGHRCSLRHLSGLLEHLQRRTRELGGNAVMVCDPHRVCFVILKPVIKTQPVPKDVVARFWKLDDDSIPTSRSDEVGAPDPGSDLTEFSKTPTPPRGSTVLDIGKLEHFKNPEATVDDGDGSVAAANCQRALSIDRDQRVDEWNADVRQSLEDEGYEPDIEDNISKSPAGDDLEPATLTEDNSMCEPVYQTSYRIRDTTKEESSEVYGNVDMPIAGALEEHQGLFEDENGFTLDGAGTPLGVHRLQSSSIDGNSATAAHMQQQHQSHPDSNSVGSAASNYGAATPHVE